MSSIPRIPSPGSFSGKHWDHSGPGKGDAPRNTGDKFRENFEDIKFPPREKNRTGFSRTIYK